MNFAINYSRQAADLLIKGEIELERFKTLDWPWMISEASAHRPVAVHFSLQAGRGIARLTDWDAIGELLDQTGTPNVNLHLSPTVEDFPGLSPDSPTATQSRRILDRILCDVSAAVEKFGPQRVIVENAPYHADQGVILRTAVEPDQIGRILDETGCGLLLDISHARISAHYLGMDEREYLASLPLDRLCELHFTGLAWVEGLLQDHMPVTDRDWKVLAWALKKIQSGEWTSPWMLVLEYGGVGGWFEDRTDPLVIAHQAPKLYKMVKSLP